MNIQEHILQHINSLPELKRMDMHALHEFMLKLMPQGQLWFEDGKNSENKTVTNPTIGYGFQTLNYANGKSRPFFQIGLSANTTGISIYLIGLKDKTYLSQTFGEKMGKAKVTGYCIKFKTIKDIHLNILEEAILYGIEVTRPS